MWWSNNDQRSQQKENIKTIIKKKKLTEKTAATTGSSHCNGSQIMTPGFETPPGLSHSLPTSATFSDGHGIDRTRSASVDSQASLFDFSAAMPGLVDYTAYNTQLLSSSPDHFAHSMYPDFSPYEIDVKTERQMFVNDSLTHKESTTSTFSTYHAPLDGIQPTFPLDGDWDSAYFAIDDHQRRTSMPEEALDMNFFDFAHGAPASVRQVAIELEDGDQRLLDHFISQVLPGIFPVLEANQHGSARTDYVLPALQSNRSYLHCCLSVAAQHYKATMSGDVSSDQMDQDIMRHRYATISELCEALNRDTDHLAVLEATLGLIHLQCSVGHFDDSLPDIPWHQHFQAAISLVQKLELPRLVAESTQQQLNPFNMTLTAWIDILGSTMQGRAPTFAHTYRDKHLSTTNSSLGLRELMGCDDRIMYLISEIACLEALKRDGMDDIQLCEHISNLGAQIGITELGESGPKIPFNAQGVLSPKQLSRNMTAAFRLAARIYLCSLVPGFSPSQSSCVGLVEKLSQVLEFIPSGPMGFDRSLVWVYLMGGAVATSSSPFRPLFLERQQALGDLADHGSYGRTGCLLREIWALMDSTSSPSSSSSSTATEAAAPVEVHHVSWRDVMQLKGWDFLLI